MARRRPTPSYYSRQAQERGAYEARKREMERRAAVARAKQQAQARAAAARHLPPVGFIPPARAKAPPVRAVSDSGGGSTRSARSVPEVTRRGRPPTPVPGRSVVYLPGKAPGEQRRAQRAQAAARGASAAKARQRANERIIAANFPEIAQHAGIETRTMRPSGVERTERAPTHADFKYQPRPKIEVAGFSFGPRTPAGIAAVTHPFRATKNLAHDAYEAGLGFAPGIAHQIMSLGQDLRDASRAAGGQEGGDYGFERTKRDVIEPIVQQYSHTYGPAFHGDFTETLRRIEEHPLGPVLDALTIMTLGFAAAGRLGVVAPVARSITTKEGIQVPLRSSPNPLTRATIEPAIDRVSELLEKTLTVGDRSFSPRTMPGVRMFSASQRGRRQLSRDLDSDAARRLSPGHEFKARAMRLNKRNGEDIAYDVMVRYGDDVVEGVDREIAGRQARMNNPDTPDWEKQNQAAQITMLRAAQKHLENPRQRLLTAVEQGRQLQDAIEAYKISAGLLRPETARIRKLEPLRMYADNVVIEHEVRDDILAQLEGNGMSPKHLAVASEMLDAAAKSWGERFDRDPQMFFDSLRSVEDPPEGALLQSRPFDENVARQRAEEIMGMSAKGAPPSIKSVDDVVEYMKGMQSAALLAEEHRHWYQRAGMAIREEAGGDPEKANKIAMLAAIYSPRKSVAMSIEHVREAMRTFEETGQVDVRTLGKQNEKAQRALEGEWPFGTGTDRKQESFYANFLETVDPERYARLYGGEDRTTQDVWMAKLFGYPKRKSGKQEGFFFKSDAEYTFAEHLTQATAQMMGWEPRELQAALWNFYKQNWELSGGNKPAQLAAADRARPSGIGESFARAKGTDEIPEVPDALPAEVAVDGTKRGTPVDIEREEINTRLHDIAAEVQHPYDVHGVRGNDLQGLPGKVDVKGRGEVNFHAFSLAQRSARDYMELHGFSYTPPKVYVKVDPERAERIAEWYDKAKHAPDDPAVRRSYEAFARETLNQFKFMERDGIDVEFYPRDEAGNIVDPYPNGPREAVLDVVENKHMYVYPTREGFGEAPIGDHPLLEDSGLRWNNEIVTHNDVFRAVHDYYGHIKEGVGFRADGEENAWRNHVAMYSEAAKPAMTSETRGQNSWVNFGPFGEKNRTASTADTTFAEQKAVLAPRWVVEEGARDPVKAPNNEFHEAAQAELDKAEQDALFEAQFLDPEEWGNHTRNILRSRGWLLQNGDQGPKGAIHFAGGRTEIYFGPGADLSTVAHELGHYILDNLDEPRKQQIYKWLGVKNELTVKQQERFARAMEGYWFQNRPPTPQLRDAMNEAAKAIGDVYMFVKKPWKGDRKFIERERMLAELWDPQLGMVSDSARYLPVFAKAKRKTPAVRRSGVSGARKKIVYPGTGKAYETGAFLRGSDATLEDFARTIRHQNVVMDIQKLEGFSKPFEKGYDPKEWEVFNPKGSVPTPDVDPLEQVLKLDPRVIDDAIRTEDQRLVSALFPEEIEGLEESQLRLIPKWVGDAFRDGRAKPRSENDMVAFWGDAIRLANRVMKTGILYLKVSYIPNNFLGAGMFAGIHQGPQGIIRSYRQYRKFSEKTLQKMDVEAGSNISQALISEKSGVGATEMNRLAEFSGRWSDRFFRRLSVIAEGRRHKITTEEQWHDLFERHADGDTEAKLVLDQISHTANEAMVRFNQLRPFERDYLAQAVFIYPWIRGATRYGYRLALDHPAKAALIAHYGEAGYEQMEQEFGEIAEFLKARGLLDLGKQTKKGAEWVWSPAALTPTGTFGESVGFLFGIGDPRQPIEYLNPVLQAGFKAAAAYDPFTQKPIEGVKGLLDPDRAKAFTEELSSMPIINDVRGVIDPEDSAIWERSRLDPVLNFLGGSSAPRKLKLDTARRLGRHEGVDETTARLKDLEYALKILEPESLKTRDWKEIKREAKLRSKVYAATAGKRDPADKVRAAIPILRRAFPKDRHELDGALAEPDQEQVWEQIKQALREKWDSLGVNVDDLVEEADAASKSSRRRP